ncbi:hypothetical protein FNF31_07013 [Cafeteria roenbergensis]|uniref:Reverse transcriptase domain-containing protein n=1 Tax=Cafeteria roenbergensis TaxID=33653 RepID=A0A5A8CBL0_CAFRO|nr:hypothetical protein FNF31_07013 [Cafeteria roenbergensis]
MDVHSVPPKELSTWLDELSRSGVLAPAVDAAANEAATSAGARHDGSPCTLVDFPIVAPLANPDVPRLCPVAVLRELRRPGDSSWHHAFACALLGAPAELSHPVAAFQPRPNRLDNAGTADSVQSLLQRDADNWWIVPVPPGARAPPPSPLSLVAKASGRGRLICDDSSRSRSGKIRGPNGACDTSRLPFPATVSIPGVAAWLRTAPVPAPGQSVFLMSWDITTAFRRIMLSAQARGAAAVRWAGRTYRFTTCSMGSRWSSSAMNAIVHAVAKSLRRADGRARVVSYCDDTLGYMVGTRAEADAFRLSVIRRFSALGLPMAEAKCPPPGTSIRWIGLSISTAGPEATIGYAPALAESLEQELASVAVCGAVSPPSLRRLLGPLGWLACVAPPVGLWLRRLRQALSGAASGAWFSRAAASGAGRLRSLFVRRVWPVSDVCRRAFPDKFPAVTLITDASSSRGGAVALAASSVANGALHDGARGRGLLPTAITVEYDARVPASTRSELLTVVHVVHSMADALAGRSVRLFSDNMAALAASCGKASSTSAHADDLGEALAALLLDNRIFLEALHIPGVENEAADLISRHDCVFTEEFAAGSATWAAGLRHAWERVAPTIRSARVNGIILRPRRLLGHAFPRLRLIADDAAALFAFLASRECLYLSAAAVSSYIGAITGFAGRTIGVHNTPDVRAHKLVAVGLAAWLPKTVDTRPPVPRRAFLDARSDKSAPLACRLALAFCFDTVSRSSEYLTESRADSCKPVPMPLGHVTVGLCPKGFPLVDLRTTVKGDRKGGVTTIRASCSPGSPECHPCGLNAARNIRAWVVWRRERGASPEEPLWRLADGRGATAKDVLDLLRKHTDLAVSLHTTRISSASEAVARGGFTLGQLATLGGWSSADACRRYVRTIGVGAS